MKLINKLIAVMVLSVPCVTLQAHEGHASVGSLAHSVEHAGWLAAGLMVMSVMILLVFSVSAARADKVLQAREATKQSLADKKPH